MKKNHLVGTGHKHGWLLVALCCFATPVAHVPELIAAAEVSGSPATLWLQNEVGIEPHAKFFEFHVRLKEETRDDKWATEMETLLQRQLAGESVEILGIECRSNRCEIRVGGFDGACGTWMRSLEGAQASYWFKQNFSYNTGQCFPKNSGRYSNLIYWILVAKKR